MSTNKREQFKKMIKDCEDGKIDMVITKSISRFARNTQDCLQYSRKLKNLGIGIFFEKENINTLDAADMDAGEPENPGVAVRATLQAERGGWL